MQQKYRNIDIYLNYINIYEIVLQNELKYQTNVLKSMIMWFCCVPAWTIKLF